MAYVLRVLHCVWMARLTAAARCAFWRQPGGPHPLVPRLHLAGTFAFAAFLIGAMQLEGSPEALPGTRRGSGTKAWLFEDYTLPHCITRSRYLVSLERERASVGPAPNGRRWPGRPAARSFREASGGRFALLRSARTDAATGHATRGLTEWTTRARATRSGADTCWTRACVAGWAQLAVPYLCFAAGQEEDLVLSAPGTAAL